MLLNSGSSVQAAVLVISARWGPRTWLAAINTSSLLRNAAAETPRPCSEAGTCMPHELCGALDVHRLLLIGCL